MSIKIDKGIPILSRSRYDDIYPPDDPYWVQTIFGIDSFLSWEDAHSINIRAVDDPHGYVWHPEGRSWLDRMLSKAYGWRTLRIAPNGYFDKDEG